MQEDDERRGSQRDEILSFLEARGPAGATNVELNEIGFRYGARLWELRKEGYRIRTESLGDGLFRFTLLSEPAEANPLAAGKSPSKPKTTVPLSLFPEMRNPEHQHG